GSSGRNYTLTGSRVLEVPVKFAYWSMSFVMGEAVPDWLLVPGALLLPLLAAVAWRGARRSPEVAWLAAAPGALGFLGVGPRGFLPVRGGTHALRAAVFPAADCPRSRRRGRPRHPALGQPGGGRHAPCFPIRRLVLLPQDRLSQQTVPLAYAGNRRPDSARIQCPGFRHPGGLHQFRSRRPGLRALPATVHFADQPGGNSSRADR